jgi:divalent metal cation (Fe/Co/Zn/Cd) transporter
MYLAFAGIRLVRQNFLSLVDMPLPEDERLRVLRVLAAFFHDYDGLGTIYTRTSGRERIVELELFFPPDKALAEIHALQAEMEEALSRELPGFRFRIIPGIRK